MKKLALFTFLCSLSLFGKEETFPWVVYYGEKAPIEDLQPYNPIVLDRDYPFSLDPLLKEKKEVLGYVNVGEVDDRDPWFFNAKAEGILLEENPLWKGSWSLDIRHPYWKDLLLNQILQGLVVNGFTGFFLDQLDVSIALEDQNPQKYGGMKKAAVDLIQSIRKQYPNHRIMLNRAYELLPEVGDEIHYELAETLFTDYNSQTQKFQLRPQTEVDWQLSQLDKSRKQFPQLVLFSLDYWDPKDKEGIKQLYTEARKQCVRPYVSTMNLDEIIPEP